MTLTPMLSNDKVTVTDEIPDAGGRPSVSTDFTRRVVGQLPRADRSRRRRRMIADLGRPAVAILVSLLLALGGATTLPAYGAEGARVAVRAVSIAVVGQAVANNIVVHLLGDLRLGWLPVVATLLVLLTIAFGAQRHMRRTGVLGGTTMNDENRPHGSRTRPGVMVGRNVLVSLLALVIAAAVLVPALAVGRGAVRLGDLEIAPDEKLTRTTLVIGGDVLILGRTASPVVVLGGDITVVGRAEDDLVTFPGTVSLAPGSVVMRDVVAIGGSVLRAEDAQIQGNVAGQQFPWSGAIVRGESDLLGTIVSRVRLGLLGAIAGALLAVAAVVIVPWLVVLTAATGRGATMQSGLIGLAGLACGPLVIVPLALSLVGAPLAILLGMALFICWWLGAASTGFLLGRWLLRLRKRDSSLTRATLLGGAVLGTLLGIPMIGGVALVLIGAVGAGAVLLSLIEGEFGSVRAPESTVGMMAYE